MRSALFALVALSLLAPSVADAASFKRGKFEARNAKKRLYVGVWMKKTRVNDIDYAAFHKGCNLGPGSQYGRLGGQTFSPNRQWYRFRNARLRQDGSFRYRDRVGGKRQDPLGNIRSGFTLTVVTGRVSGRTITGTVRWEAKSTFLGANARPGTAPRIWRCSGSETFRARWRSREIHGPSSQGPPRVDENEDNEEPVYEWSDYTLGQPHGIGVHLQDRWSFAVQHSTECGDIYADLYAPGDSPEPVQASGPPNKLASPLEPQASGTVSVSAERVGANLQGTITWDATVTRDSCSTVVQGSFPFNAAPTG